MLEHTFCHIPRVSERKEQLLWSSGMHSWNDARSRTEWSGLKVAARHVLTHLEESAKQLEAANAAYFATGLPGQQHWRLFSDFRDSIGYLDIETTGLSGSAHKITTIALYDGREVRYYVQGQNLENFRRDVRECDVLVTYNGKCFDLPFLHQSLGIHFPQPHIDLRYVLARLGFRGGLKGCEKQLGIDRGELDGVDGYTAVLLWQDYQRSGNVKALETLLAYNIEDVLNLESLMVLAYNRLIGETPFGPTNSLALPYSTPNPFQAHQPTLRRILTYQGVY